MQHAWKEEVSVACGEMKSDECLPQDHLNREVP